LNFIYAFKLGFTLAGPPGPIIGLSLRFHNDCNKEATYLLTYLLANCLFVYAVIVC